MLVPPQTFGGGGLWGRPLAGGLPLPPPGYLHSPLGGGGGQLLTKQFLFTLLHLYFPSEHPSCKGHCRDLALWPQVCAAHQCSCDLCKWGKKKNRMLRLLDGAEITHNCTYKAKMPQNWELSVEAGGVWAPGKQMHVLSQESCQQLPADALEKQCHLIHHSFFYPPSFMISISKGRTLHWSEDHCGEQGKREKSQIQFLRQRSLMTPNKTIPTGEKIQVFI